MKISINTAQYFSNVDIKAIGREQLVDKIGAQLGAVDEVVDWAPKFEGVVIVRVASCVDHPNADKLHVCKVDDGGVVKDVERDEDGYVQVVCGAPNVREGLLVAWIPPGATVPTTSGASEPFVLASKELRGVMSNGMLASAAELGLSDNHDGLLEIEESEVGRELTVGEAFVHLYGLDDLIVDVENKMFTHRPDCFGAFGVAREIAGITNQAFKSPSWYLEAPNFANVSDLPLHIKVEIPELVPRFMAIALKNIEIKPSPNWLQSALTRIGIRPINNVVDVTNFVMYVTAQPLHAYDYDKVAALSEHGAEIIVRKPNKDEKIVLLNGKEITPRDEAIMIASSQKAIGLGGVMGGADTEVDETTKNIILEVASFDMYSIRRTAMAHGLFTDAVTRFNKGQSPLQNDRVLAYAVDQLQQLASAEQASDVIDVAAVLPENPTLTVSASFINDRLGLALSVEEMHALLNNVEFTVRTEGSNLIAKAPFWRTDIEIAEDIVEEIGRLYGFDHVPLVLPLPSSMPTVKNDLLELKSTLRHTLKSAGANEVLSYSFVHGELMKKVGQNAADAFSLSNALSPQLQYYRTSLTPSLLEKVHPNLKAGYDEFALFELGKSHNLAHAVDAEGVPHEFEKLSFVYAASGKVTNKDSGAAFYKAKNYLFFIADKLGLTFDFAPFISDAEPPFETTRSALILTKDGKNVGVIGEYTQSAISNLKLPKQTAGFELAISEILHAVHGSSNYIALPKFPKVSQDISLRVPVTSTYAEIETVLRHALDAQKPSQSLAVLEPIDIYTNEDNHDVKHVTFRLSIMSYKETLRADAINALLDTIAQTAKQKIGAERI